MASDFLSIEQAVSPFRDIKFCPACKNGEFDPIFDFGKVPLAGYFPNPGESNDKYMIPMELRICKSCQLVQINPDVSDEILFEDYRYISSVGMQSHFYSFAQWFSETKLADKSASILEIGCNDGPLLEELTQLGFKPIGIDPASNIVKQASEKGLNVICDFFNLETVAARKLTDSYDIVISCNSFAHISNIDNIAKSIALVLKNSGLFIVEVQSLSALVSAKAYDFVYHEHKYYYSIASISNLLHRHGLYLVDGMEVSTHGGSLRLVFSKTYKPMTENLKNLIDYENSLNLTAKSISQSVVNFMRELSKLKQFLKTASEKNQLCVGLGASGRANMLLNYILPEAKVITAVYDESPERIGREMALSGVPVKRLESSTDNFPAIVLVLAWNFSDVLIKKWNNPNSIFVLPLPQFSVIENQ